MIRDRLLGRLARVRFWLATVESDSVRYALLRGRRRPPDRTRPGRIGDRDDDGASPVPWA